MSIKISVVIPTHNRIEGLHTTLRSLLEQTHLPDEVIVTDDGSNPAVDSSIFDVFPEKVKCVLLRNEQPKGGNNARNQGVMAASGDYIAFLDDDDQFKPNKVEVLQREIAKNASVDVFYHPAHIHMLNEGVSYISKPYGFSQDEDVYRSLLVQNRIGGTPMVTVRKQALLDVGLFDEQMPAMQDYELWLRLAKNKYKFYLIECPLTDYNYMTKKGSVSKSISVNATAIDLIERKYVEGYASLNQSEQKAYRCWKQRKLVHKSLLNGDLVGAFKYQLVMLKIDPSLRNILTLLTVPLGSKFIFKLKARIG